MMCLYLPSCRLCHEFRGFQSRTEHRSLTTFFSLQGVRIYQPAFAHGRSIRFLEGRQEYL